jgi:hypothetical protein
MINIVVCICTSCISCVCWVFTWKKNYVINYTGNNINTYMWMKVHIYFCMAQKPLVDLGRLTREVSGWYSDTPHSVETSTWQHTSLTKDKYPCPGGIRTNNHSTWKVADSRLRAATVNGIRRVTWGKRVYGKALGMLNCRGNLNSQKDISPDIMCRLYWR